MPIRPPEFDSTALWLAPILDNLPPRLVAITGPLGAGKTTLARFLAWYFNSSLIETDHYLVPHKGLQIEPKEVARIIEHRKSIHRPVIVEGVAILPLFAKIGLVPDCIIQVWNNSASRRPSADEMQLINSTKWGFDKCPSYKMVIAQHG